MAEENNTLSPIELATELTIAWLSNANTRASAEEALSFLNTMRDAITVTPDQAAADSQVASEYVPAVSVRKSLGSPEHIISMIDGKPYKMLTRHLATHGLNADQYRARYGLKSDYPMVAPAYAEKRRELARKIGLGRKPRVKRNTQAKG